MPLEKIILYVNLVFWFCLATLMCILLYITDGYLYVIVALVGWAGGVVSKTLYEYFAFWRWGQTR